MVLVPAVPENTDNYLKVSKYIIAAFISISFKMKITNTLGLGYGSMGVGMDGMKTPSSVF